MILGRPSELVSVDASASSDAEVSELTDDVDSESSVLVLPVTTSPVISTCASAVADGAAVGVVVVDAVVKTSKETTPPAPIVNVPSDSGGNERRRNLQWYRSNSKD